MTHNYEIFLEEEWLNFLFIPLFPGSVSYFYIRKQHLPPSPISPFYLLPQLACRAQLLGPHSPGAV